jgi:hypothetical protein
LNKDDAAQQIDLSIKNYVSDFRGSVWQLHGSSVSDKFPELARTDSIFKPDDIASLTLPANSVTILKLQRDDVRLPVTLENFEAIKNDSVVELNWKILNERNIAEYIIERSADGQNFLTIGTIAAANEDSSVYNYVDVNISNSAVLYYRLIIVAADGNKVSSKVVSVTIDTSLQIVTVHPNPFEDNLLVRVKCDTDKKVSIFMIDVMGRTVLREERLLYQGNNQIALNNLDRLMKGLYLLKIVDDSSSKTLKVVKR